MQLIFLISIPTLVIAIGLIIKTVKPKFEDMQKKIDNINNIVQENLVGIELLNHLLDKRKKKRNLKK